MSEPGHHVATCKELSDPQRLEGSRRKAWTRPCSHPTKWSTKSKFHVNLHFSAIHGQATYYRYPAVLVMRLTAAPSNPGVRICCPLIMFVHVSRVLGPAFPYLFGLGTACKPRAIDTTVQVEA